MWNEMGKKWEEMWHKKKGKYVRDAVLISVVSLVLGVCGAIVVAPFDLKLAGKIIYYALFVIAALISLGATGYFLRLIFPSVPSLFSAFFEMWISSPATDATEPSDGSQGKHNVADKVTNAWAHNVLDDDLHFSNH